MYHKIRWIRISNKDKSRIKVDTIDKFRPFRACYVFFFFFPRHFTNSFSYPKKITWIFAKSHHTRALLPFKLNARASRSNSRHSRISPLIPHPHASKLWSTFPPDFPSRRFARKRRGEDVVLVVIVAITIIIFRGLEKKKRKNDARVFRTSTGIIQVGSTRHNYAPTEWLSFFKPALTPARPRREHPHSCAPAKLHLPAAAPTTGAVAAAHPACLPRGRPQSTVNAIHVPSPSLRSLLHFLPASYNYFV